MQFPLSGNDDIYRISPISFDSSQAIFLAESGAQCVSKFAAKTSNTGLQFFLKKKFSPKNNSE